MKTAYNEIIKKLRIEHKLTQRDIAKQLNTTQQVYSRYEKGESELPIRHLITLSKIFNVSTDYILSTDSVSKDNINIAN